MRADPKLAAAIDAAPPEFRKGLQGQLNTHWDQQNKVDNQTNFDYLRGLAYTDRGAFLNKDRWRGPHYADVRNPTEPNPFPA